MTELDIKSTAVLGLHWLNDIVTPNGAFGPMFAAEVESRQVVPATARLFQAARSRGVPIVYTRVCYAAGHTDLVVSNPLFAAVKEYKALVDGQPGAEIIPELAPRPGELVISNSRVNGFVNSPLDFLLRSRGIDTVVLTGVSTNITVESTARLATDLGYRAIVASDCVSADSAAGHDAAIAIMNLLAEVSSSEMLIKAIES